MKIGPWGGVLTAVALDFDARNSHDSNPLKDIKRQGLRFAQKIQGTDVFLKLGAHLIYDWEYCQKLRALGFRLFFDPKHTETPTSLARYASIIGSLKPEFVTTMVRSSRQKGMRVFKAGLPKVTNVLGVMVFSSADETEEDPFQLSPKEEILSLGNIFMRVGTKGLVDGLVVPPTEIRTIKEGLGGNFFVAVPNIRPEGILVSGDDQNQAQSMTPEEAVKAGASMLIIGRPVTQAKDPRAVLEKILEETRAVSAA